MREAPSLEIVEAGRVPYGDALERQRKLAHARIAGSLDHDVLLLVEHPEVVTLGRASQTSHVLDAEGIEVVEVERGGDVTYHGPGQLVGYPILDLQRHRPDLHWYLRTLEQALLEALAILDVPAVRHPGYTGVWVRDERGGGARKIASIGVHVKQWVTWHGFALNVTTDLAQFDRIVPCGISDVEMTSLERECRSLGRGTPSWDDVVTAVARGFELAFGMTAARTAEDLALR